MTAITLDNDSDDQLGHAKLTELMKVKKRIFLSSNRFFYNVEKLDLIQGTSPEVQYRLKCGLSGLNKTSSQLLRNSGDKMISSTSSTLQNANKQLETLSRKVGRRCQFGKRKSNTSFSGRYPSDSCDRITRHRRIFQEVVCPPCGCHVDYADAFVVLLFVVESGGNGGAARRRDVRTQGAVIY